MAYKGLYFGLPFEPGGSWLNTKIAEWNMEEVVRMINGLPEIEKVYVSSYEIRSVHNFARWARALGRLPRLQELRYHDYSADTSDEARVAFWKELSSQGPKLRILKLDVSFIHDDMFAPLKTLFASVRVLKLERFWFSGRDKDKNRARMTELFEAASHLQSLSLDGHLDESRFSGWARCRLAGQLLEFRVKVVSPENLRILIGFLQHSGRNLKQLGLDISSVLMSRHSSSLLPLFQAIQNLPSLQELECDMDPGFDVVAQFLSSYVRTTQTLRRLQATLCCYSGRVPERRIDSILADALRENQSLVFVRLSPIYGGHCGPQIHMYVDHNRVRGTLSPDGDDLAAPVSIAPHALARLSTKDFMYTILRKELGRLLKARDYGTRKRDL